jgi:hypothetical protein
VDSQMHKELLDNLNSHNFLSSKIDCYTHISTRYTTIHHNKVKIALQQNWHHEIQVFSEWKNV